MRQAPTLLSLAAAWFLGCQPPVAPQVADAPDARAGVESSTDPCREDIPDCAAVCALRETGRKTHIDFYERRCAAVILGRNPDKVVTDLQPTPYSDASVVEVFPTTVPTMAPPFDPISVGRADGSEPPECKASRLLRAQRRDREADMMAALCAAKGGDAGL